MPVAKGKKKSKRERRRFGSASPVQVEEQPAQSGSKPARPRRRAWEGPPWLNLALGVVMVVAGIIFAVVNTGGALILVAYWVVGGFYLWRAYRQYQAKRTS